jgi:Delta7-sterol 5-desaturase
MPELLRTQSLATLAGLVFSFFAAWTVLGLVVGFAAERALPRRRVFAVRLAPGQYRFELVGNVVFLATATVTMTAVLRSGMVRLGEPSLARDGLTFLALAVGFQVFYWLLHRALHTRRLVFIHLWHHRSRVTTPLSGQSMSAGEALAWMLGYAGLPLALSLVVPIGFFGWAAYLAFNVSSNVVGHANVELTAKAAATRTATLFANTFVYHALHHARWTENYSFQAAGMDRLFGTEAEDWPELYARIAAGQPLTSLHARGEAHRGRRARRARS